MKTLNLILILIVVSGTTLFAQTDEEKKAIEETVLNYLEGWYDGDVERMNKALHPELAKRVIATLPQTGTTFINTATKAMMVEYTRAGFGKQTPREKLNNEVEVLDVYKGIATVKAVSYDFVDYCHVVKQDGEWKIINVLWERIPHEKEEE
jgi:DNA phosphorothioation-dependent restriction protein DptG